MPSLAFCKFRYRTTRQLVSKLQRAFPEHQMLQDSPITAESTTISLALLSQQVQPCMLGAPAGLVFSAKSWIPPPPLLLGSPSPLHSHGNSESHLLLQESFAGLMEPLPSHPTAKQLCSPIARPASRFFRPSLITQSATSLIRLCGS